MIQARDVRCLLIEINHQKKPMSSIIESKIFLIFVINTFLELNFLALIGHVPLKIVIDVINTIASTFNPCSKLLIIKNFHKNNQLIMTHQVLDCALEMLYYD